MQLVAIEELPNIVLGTLDHLKRGSHQDRTVPDGINSDEQHNRDTCSVQLCLVLNSVINFEPLSGLTSVDGCLIFTAI